MAGSYIGVDLGDSSATSKSGEANQSQYTGMKMINIAAPSDTGGFMLPLILLAGLYLYLKGRK